MKRKVIGYSVTLAILLIAFEADSLLMLADANSTYGASFRISGDEYDQTVKYNNKDNLVFCYLYRENNGMWIRLARDTAEMGEEGPHIDIDICNYRGTGNYEVMDPQVRPCSVGPLWDIWWHADDKTYLNQSQSSPCSLSLVVDGEMISGVFNCYGMVPMEGEGSINITDGLFRCSIISK